MRRDLLIVLVLVAVGLVQNLAHVDSTPFHRDEARWTHRARYVRHLQDPLGDYWRDRGLMRGQAPLGSYLMGVGLLAQGRDLDTNGLWSLNHSAAWNRREGRMPTAADLTAARRTDAVVGALTVVALYLLTRRFGNRVAGAAAALLVIPHPLHIYLSSLAGSDALLALLVLLAALAAWRLAERPTWPRALLLGVLLGLGGATKLSPLLVTLPLAALGGALVGWGWLRQPFAWRQGRSGATPPEVAARRADRGLGWRLLALPLIAIVVFVATYPYLWPDPITRTGHIFAFRAGEMENQGDIWNNVAVETRAEALQRVGLTLTRYFSTTGRALAELPAGWQPDDRLATRLRELELALAVPGLLILVAIVWSRGPRSPHALAAIVLGAQVGITIVGMRADFARYHLPILLAAALCTGLVAGRGWDALRAAPRLRPLLTNRPWRRLRAGVRSETPGEAPPPRVASTSSFDLLTPDS